MYFSHGYTDNIENYKFLWNTGPIYRGLQPKSYYSILTSSGDLEGIFQEYLQGTFKVYLNMSCD